MVVEEKELRNTRLNIRVKPKELIQYKELANRKDMSMSDWIRKKLNS